MFNRKNSLSREYFISKMSDYEAEINALSELDGRIYKLHTQAYELQQKCERPVNFSLDFVRKEALRSKRAEYDEAVLELQARFCITPDKIVKEMWRLIGCLTGAYLKLLVTPKTRKTT